MESSQRIRIDGHVSAGFEAVRDAFAENFSRRRELGGACCVYHRGEKVVDLWGGVRNKSTSEPWEEDTMVVVHSATKGLGAMTLAVAHSRGWLDYEERISSYWPEFAQHGKETITVRQLLAHQAGLFAFNEPVDRSVVADLDQLASSWRASNRRGSLARGKLITRSPWATKTSCCAESIQTIAAWDSSFRTRSLRPWGSTSTSGCPIRYRTRGSRRSRAQAFSRCSVAFRSDSCSPRSIVARTSIGRST